MGFEEFLEENGEKLITEREKLKRSMLKKINFEKGRENNDGTENHNKSGSTRNLKSLATKVKA